MYKCTYKWPRPAVTRCDLASLESAMFAENNGDNGLDACQLTHHHAPQVYGREIFVPAGVTVVGKIHRHAHLNVVISGLALVVTEFGRREVRAGDVFVSEPGTKRAVHVIEDIRWMTIHPNQSDTRDLVAIEDYVIAPDYAALGSSDKEKLQ